MVRLFLFTIVLLIGSSMVIAKNDIKFRKIYQKRFSGNNEHHHSLRNLMDGEKQQATLLNSEMTVAAPPLIISSSPNREEIACLSACHYCVEGHSIETRKKKSDDNCGPTCDCADSCFRMPAKQVDKIFGQNANSRGDKDCWWRTYHEMFNNEILLSL